jgi:hypothetical protein
VSFLPSHILGCGRFLTAEKWAEILALAAKEPDKALDEIIEKAERVRGNDKLYGGIDFANSLLRGST